MPIDALVAATIPALAHVELIDYVAKVIMTASAAAWSAGGAYSLRSSCSIPPNTQPASPRHFCFPCTQELTHVEHLTAFCDVRQQHINEWMPGVQRRTPPMFGRNNSLNYRQVALAERISLVAKEALLSAIGRRGIAPSFHDPATDKGGYFFGAVPRV